MDGEQQTGSGVVFLNPGGEVDAVGESRYQRVLEHLAGGKQEHAARIETTAVLVPEPANPRDPQAVRIEIGGQLVGYLGRADAPRYRPVVDELARAGRVAACRALIVGGWRRGGDEGHFGVKLDLAAPEGVLSRAPSPATAVLPASPTEHAGAVSATGRSSRPWWRRKRVLLPVGAVVLLALPGLFGAGDEDEPAQVRTAVPTVVTTTIPTTTTTTAVPTTTTTVPTSMSVPTISAPLPTAAAPTAAAPATTPRARATLPPPTAGAVAVPETAPAATSPARESSGGGGGDPADAAGDRDCRDFATWTQAQRYYEAQGGPGMDPDGLDDNRDGVACESLPGAPG